MLARASRESEETQAAEEARILAEQALAMERAKAELQASQARNRNAPRPTRSVAQAGRSKATDVGRADDDRAKLEALAREAPARSRRKPSAPTRSGPRSVPRPPRLAARPSA